MAVAEAFQTKGFLMPTCVAIRCTGSPAIEAGIMRARSAYFCGRLRSDAIASNRTLSDALTITQ